ncbi:MAG: amidohydrolase/deacetylase family metallohydrolase [Chloroflexi bacterium]|nr:amidohydrolase/deacetylase family metallohydrolase [Chloroflexota bacterium]
MTDQRLYDLVLRGGEIIDPSQNLRKRADVAIASGKIAAIVDSIPRGAAKEEIDVNGHLVTSGLIDIHAHCYHRVFLVAVDPDTTYLPMGVTTAVDAGSSGWFTFAGLRDYVLAKSQVRLYAFLHIGSLGLLPLAAQPELLNLDFADVKGAVGCIERNREWILGVKVRIAQGATGRDNALPALERARQAAEAGGVKLMVHVSDSPVPLSQIIERLRPGDILTHIFHGYEHGILDARGRVRPEVREAAQAGIVLDVAHATGHFSIRVAREALAQGLTPHTLSTDLTRPRSGLVVEDLLGVMSIYLALGMSLEEVIRGVTVSPTAAMGKAGELGTLAIGAPADIAVLKLQEGDFIFRDIHGEELPARQRFQTILTVREGKPYRW